MSEVTAALHTPRGTLTLHLYTTSKKASTVYYWIQLLTSNFNTSRVTFVDDSLDRSGICLSRTEFSPLSC